MDINEQKQLLLDRRKRFAEQSQYQGPTGQMVDGHFVAPNPLQYLAAGLRSIGGMTGEKYANEELQALGKKERDLMGSETKALAQALRGTQGAMVAPATANDDEGNINPQVQMQGTHGSFEAFTDRALQSQLPQFQQLGMQGIMKMPEIEAREQDRIADREFKMQQIEQNRQDKLDQLKIQHEQRMEYLAQNNADRSAMAAEQRAFQASLAQANRDFKATIGGSSQPYFQPVQTAQGVMAFNARTGRMDPIAGADGMPVVGAQFDPALQGSLAGAKTGATTEAKMRTEARLEAPKAISQGEETIRLVDDLLKAPGMKQAVGASRMLGVQKIPGTAAKDFDVRLDQLKGTQFLQAYESLKGGGAITELEGKKATDAIARMDAASSEPEFQKAAREFQAVIRQGVSRAKNAQGGQPAMPAQKNKDGDDSVTVQGKTYAKPANMSAEQWNDYKQSVGAK